MKKSAIFCAQMVNFCRPSHTINYVSQSLQCFVQVTCHFYKHLVRICRFELRSKIMFKAKCPFSVNIIFVKVAISCYRVAVTGYTYVCICMYM